MIFFLSLVSLEPFTFYFTKALYNRCLPYPDFSASLLRLRDHYVVLVIRNPPADAGDVKDEDSTPGSGRPPGIGNPTPVFLLGKFHGQRGLAGYFSWGRKEVDVARPLSTHVE